RWRPTLEAIAAGIERIAADPAVRRDPRHLRREIWAARTALRHAVTELEGMAGTVPFDALADGLLILNRVRDVLHGLAMVVITAAASRRDRSALLRKRG